MAKIAYMTCHWNARTFLYRLSHLLLQSIKYRLSYTVSKIVRIDENMQKLYFRVHLKKQILHV